MVVSFWNVPSTSQNAVRECRIQSLSLNMVSFVVDFSPKSSIQSL